MNLRITCHGTIEHTDVLDEHIRQKLEKVTHFLSHEREPQEIALIIEGHPNHAHHEVHMRVSSPQYHRMARREGNNALAVIDEVIDIIYHDLCKDKEALVDRKKGTNHRPG